MFFNLVKQNAKKSRNENLIYFATLVTAVASFYLILSLEHQSLITYLKDFESEAVDRLFNLMPILYGFALFLLFFLVLFANRYQLERRSKEFGLYLILGMQHKNLLILLFAESIFTSAFALILGLTSGVLLAEGISLTTSRLIGQGIIGHQLSFSLEACMYTAIGFLFIQFLALIILATRLFNQEVHTLLIGQVEKKQAMGKAQTNWLGFVVGVVLLGIAYWLIIQYFWVVNVPMIALAILLGLVGTFLVIRGGTRILNGLALKKSHAQGLSIFTLRQLQENIANRSIAITVSSILMMFSLILLAEGGSMIMSSSSQIERESSVYDFTVQGEDDAVQEFLESEEMSPFVHDLNPLEIGMFNRDFSFDWSNLRKIIVDHLPEGMEDPAISNPNQYSIGPEQSEAENLLGLLTGRIESYFIRESSYNRLLESAGVNPIHLKENEMAIYVNPDFQLGDQALLKEILTNAKSQNEPLLLIDDLPIYIEPNLPMKGLVVDRSISIMSALVVSDSLFERFTSEINRSTYWNFILPPELKEEQGLMEPMKEASELLGAAGFQYESYLHNFGRQLFYIVAGSYTMLYLAFLFLIICCTVLALQFLTQFKQTKRRYQTLSFLGAKPDQVKQSIKKQVVWYFLFPLIPALISGVVGMISMKTYMRLNTDFLPEITQMLPFVFMMILLFLLVQWIYARAVFKASIHEIQQLEYK